MIHEDYQTAYARIWYDGHLVLGQRYEVNIENELSDADFVLLVLTKNTVEKGNYVLDVEYPLAKKLGKKIIPILTKEVEVQEVSKVFLDLPKPIDYDDVKAVAEAICSTIPEKKRDNADFITMGSAYAYGTETDVDFRLAAHMFFRALEAGDDIPETISHLHNVMTIAPAKDAVLAASVLVDYFSSKGYDEGDYEKYMDALRIEAECYAVLSDYDKEVESLKRGISLLESLGLVNDTYLSLLARMAELIIEGEGLEEAVEYLKRKAPLKLHDPKHPEPIDPDHEYCYIEGEIHNMATVAHIKAVYALAQLNAGELNRYLLNDVYALLMNLSMGDIINYPSSAYHYAVAFQRFATIISAIGGRKILDGMWDKAYENCAMFYPLDTSLSIDIPKHIYSQTKRIVDPSEENFKGEFDEIVSVMTFVPDGLKLKMAMAFLGLATSANAMGKPYGIYAVIGLTLFKEVVEIDPTVQPYAELLNSMLLANGFPDEDSMGKAAKLYEKATAQFDKKDCKKALENLKSALSILDDYMVLDNFVISLYIKINNLLTKCQYEIDWGRKSKNLWSTRKDLTLSLILLPYVEDKDSDLYLDTCLLAEKVYRQSGEAKRSLQYAYLARISAK